MTNRRKRPLDMLSTGELLVDLISTDFADHFDEVTNFKRVAGGSPANLCMNMARLGNRTKLIASVGNDDIGKYLLEYVKRLHVDVRHLRLVDIPTTLILVTRSRNVSNFEAYRGADCQIGMEQFPDEVLENISLFHTTCFALSLPPAQTNIMQAARQAAGQGCQLSIDANYAKKIWKDQNQAQRIVAEYVGLGAICKVSEVDWERLYNEPLRDPEKAAQHFLGLGAREVCITLGAEGCFVASAEEKTFLPSRKVEVKDTTGAGDAFWSGYLTAWLDGYSPGDCAKAGRRMAELKLGYFGPLPDFVDPTSIYEDIISPPE